jgi:site-specific DNA-methyltransferase (adenine-specific)
VIPYWQSEDGAIVVYCARWEDVVAAGLVNVPDVALVHADPPYGQDEQTNRGERGRGKGSPRSKALTAARDFPRVQGDDRPFDPAPLLALGRPLVTWGAHRYADRLPVSPSWLWWDKRERVLPDDNGDGEIAWSNLGGPLRQFHHVWKGAIRASERGVPHVHPTQKPVALSAWVFARARLRRGDLVFVPYGGSGPDLPACAAAGLRCVWVEDVRAYCDTAIARLGAITPARAREPAGPLFLGFGGRRGAA